MALTVSNLNDETASFTLSVGNESVAVVYYSGRVTTETIQEIERISKMVAKDVTETYKAIDHMLVRLIKSWDLFEDDEHMMMFPLIPEHLATLPAVFRLKVLSATIKAAMADQEPPKFLPEIRYLN